MTAISTKLIEERLLSKNLSSRELRDVLELFESEFSSPRRLSTIRSMSDLLELLNTLDICNEYDMSAYMDIADKLGDSLLYSHLKNLKPIRRMPGENVYALERISCEEEEQIKLMEQLSIQKNNDLDNYNGNHVNSTLRPGCSSNAQNYTAASLGEKMKKIIYKVINDGIGRKWREFGRELNIPEGIMDQFDENPDTRVFKILERFENDPTRQSTRFIFDLTEALTACRRKNLAKDIESILANN